MIDFRYHMVSLAAVLIALSMGIVLGAGPLRDDIGNTLTNEVTKLREDKADLRRQVAEHKRTTDQREAFDEAMLPRIVDGRLAGRTVAVVRLPESDDSAVSGIEQSIDDSGATREPTISVESPWATSGDSAGKVRTEAAADAWSALGRQGKPGSLEEILGIIIGGRTTDGSQVPDQGQRSAAFDSLDDSTLVSGTTPATTADLVVVVGGPVPGDPQTNDKDPDPTAAEVATTWVRLAEALDSSSDGVVLAADPAGAGSGDASPVTVARSDTKIAEGVSTVDVPGLAPGRATVVLALVEQAAGESGSYGLGADADAPIPDQP